MESESTTLQLQNPNYDGWQKRTVLFLSSQGLSLFGSMLVQYAIIWYITLTTRSGAILTIATIAAFLPQIVISLFAGVWADRYPRKLLIVSADALTAVSTLILAVLFLLGHGSLWLLILVSGIRSIGAGLQTPAVGAFLPQIVPTDRLIKVNGVNGTLQPFIMIAAPITSGILLSASRLEAIFFIDVFTAILAVSLLLILKVPAHHKAATGQTTGYFEDLKRGLTYIGQKRAIKRLFVFFAFGFFLVAPVAFLTPLLVTRSFGEEVWRLTANEVTFFVGSIVGGIIMTAWGGFQNRFRTIAVSFIIWGVLFAGLGLSRNFYLYLGIMFLAGIPMPMLNVPSTTLLQEMVEPDMQGRVFGVMQLITTTALPLGMLVFGPIADFFTVEVLLVVVSGLMVIPGLWMYRDNCLGKARQATASTGYEMQPGDCA
jgi:DHA3 family macrolide efflux protein-like MFS transporter